MSELPTYVVIAAFREAAVITGVVTGVMQVGYKVVVVDDGSGDGTAFAAERAGATVLRHSINLGQGAALQTGIEWSLRRGAEIIVTFDADGQHRASDLPRLVTALQKNCAHFALGSRFLGGVVDQPLSRRILLRLATAFTRLTTGLSVTDTHNGLRAMTRRGAQAILLRQNRMAHASEILDQVAKSKLRFIEVPVTIDYSTYSLAKGQSLGDAVLILTDLFAGRLQR